MADQTTARNTPGPFKTNGLNHLALVSSDMARTVAFYEGVLGFPLVMTIDMGGGYGQHFFFDIGGGAKIAFFYLPGSPAAAPGIASPAVLPGQGDFRTAVGSMNHVAIDVSPDDIDDYREKLRAAGIDCSPIMNHDHSPRGYSDEVHDGVFVRSIYFFDPDGINLEFAAWTRALRPSDVTRSSVAGGALAGAAAGSPTGPVAGN
jgi:catechol 2,3-dioxygenase-like lactoylglutathione lyase family enzyme